MTDLLSVVCCAACGRKALSNADLPPRHDDGRGRRCPGRPRTELYRRVDRPSSASYEEFFAEAPAPPVPGQTAITVDDDA